MPPDTQAPAATPAPAQTQQLAQPPAQSSMPAPAVAPADANQPPSLTSPPIAIVPLDKSIPGAALSVGGAMQAWNGRATSPAAERSPPERTTAQVTLPYRGTLHVCASTTVHLTADASAPAGEVPGLLIALDRGAVETSFALCTRNADMLLTPNFRIMIGTPGASEVKVRLGQNGDTCVDNSGANAPYVVVTSVFDGGLYRVQPGQRVMFEHGSLQTVVDQEKEPCGCPPPGQKPNEFPLAQSEGLTPLPALPPPTTPTPSKQPAGSGEGSTTLVYNAPGNQTPQPAAIPQPPAAPPRSPLRLRRSKLRNPSKRSRDSSNESVSSSSVCLERSERGREQRPREQGNKKQGAEKIRLDVSSALPGSELRTVNLFGLHLSRALDGANHGLRLVDRFLVFELRARSRPRCPRRPARSLCRRPTAWSGWRCRSRGCRRSRRREPRRRRCRAARARALQ